MAMASVPSPHVSHSAPPADKRRNVNWGLLFFFSCFFPPGSNYMYMGLIKRGLAAMCGFFFLIYMIAAVPRGMTLPVVFAFVIFILTCIFDGFHIRRRINAGEAVGDDISEIIGSVLKNKMLCLIIFVMLGILFLGAVFGIVSSLLSNIPLLFLIGFGLYIIFRRRKSKPPGQ